MSPKFPSLLLAAGCAVAMSSCSVFKKDEPAPAQEPYPAATAYGAGATGAAPANPAYGTPGATEYGSGGYTPPNYNQPYVQPSTPPAGPGYTGIYDNPAGTTGTARSSPGVTGSGRTYKIMHGDNLTKIGKRFNVIVAAL